MPGRALWAGVERAGRVDRRVMAGPSRASPRARRRGMCRRHVCLTGVRAGAGKRAGTRPFRQGRRGCRRRKFAGMVTSMTHEDYAVTNGASGAGGRQCRAGRTRGDAGAGPGVAVRLPADRGHRAADGPGAPGGAAAAAAGSRAGAAGREAVRSGPGGAGGRVDGRCGPVRGGRQVHGPARALRGVGLDLGDASAGVAAVGAGERVRRADGGAADAARRQGRARGGAAGGCGRGGGRDVPGDPGRALRRPAGGRRGGGPRAAADRARAQPGGLHGRRVGAQWRQPASRGGGAGHRGRRHGRAGLRRAEGRLRLGHLADRACRRAGGRGAQGARHRPGGAAGGVRGGTARGRVPGHRPGGQEGDQGSGVRRVLHPPDRARHRRDHARAAVHGRGRASAAGAGNVLLDRAGHLPAGPVRGPHRGHRDVYGVGRAAAERDTAGAGGGAVGHGPARDFRQAAASSR